MLSYRVLFIAFKGAVMISHAFHVNYVCSYSKRADATEDLADAIEVFFILVLLCFVPCKAHKTV